MIRPRARALLVFCCLYLPAGAGLSGDDHPEPVSIPAHRRALAVKVPKTFSGAIRTGQRVDLLGEGNDPAGTTLIIPNVLLLSIDSTRPDATHVPVTVALSPFEAEIVKAIDDAKGSWRIEAREADKPRK